MPRDGITIAQIATEFDDHEMTLHTWIRQSDTPVAADTYHRRVLDPAVGAWFGIGANGMKRPFPIAQENPVNLVRRPMQILRDNPRAYLIANLVMYGIVLVGFGIGVAFPELAAARATTMEEDGTADLVQRVFLNPWLFAATILGVNVITVGLLSIVLPSLVIPFAGLAIFGCRAVVIGVTLAPTDDATWIAMIPHSLTVVIEFQAYILLSLGVHVLGRAWISPSSVGEELHRRGYLQGLKQLGWLALAALALLIIGALYEAFSMRYLVPVLLLG
ncbi:hypothetical protein [Brachybacterium sp.]|uniref:hypothetical protein n=1 Tax=Brachybacterium sp. TaxID=1891286 RepID=UPI002ED288B0